MAHETLAFAIIAIIIVIVFLFIFYRLWEIIKPYVILAQKIIRVIDIITNFTAEVAITLLNLIKDVITGIFKIFNFGDTVVLALNNAVAKIDDLLDEETINKLISEGKRIVVTAIGQSSDNAVRFANQLANRLAPVSLVLFDGDKRSTMKVDNRIHTINITSKDLNVSARGEDDISVFNVSRSQNARVNYNIIKPKDTNVDGYIESLKNGFI